MKKKSLYELLVCALFAALTAVFSQFSVPIGPVPINLALFPVFLAGGILGSGNALFSTGIYILLGAAGLPVFAETSGGVSVLAGPTGGYIAGYAAAAWIVGLLADRFGRRVRVLVPAMIAGLAACYFLGTAWFLFVTKRTVAESLALCVLPFLPGDGLKIAVAATLSPRLRKVYNRVEKMAAGTA